MSIPSAGCGCCCEAVAERQATWSESRCDRESRPARPLCLKRHPHVSQTHLNGAAHAHGDLTLTWRPERRDDRPNTSRCVPTDHHRKSLLQEHARVLRYTVTCDPPRWVEDLSSVFIERKPIWVRLDMFRLNRDRSSDGAVAFLRSIYSRTDIFKDGGALCNLSQS